MIREGINLRGLSVSRLGLSIDGRVHAHKWGTVRSDIVLVSSESASLRCDTLQLLLRRCVRVADGQRQGLLTKPGAGEPLDNLITDFAGLEARFLLGIETIRQGLGNATYRQNPTPRLLPRLSRRILLDRML